MEPKITVLPEKILIGQRLRMSLRDNRTRELWRNFMPRRKEIRHAVSSDLYSLQVYDATYFEPFDPEKTFEKWALVEVIALDEVPAGMETFRLPGGLYAVFTYRGLPADPAIFRYIFSEWLPRSAYTLDQRPHFEVLGEKYKNNDPDSEEEIWIPLKPKA